MPCVSLAFCRWPHGTGNATTALWTDVWSAHSARRRFFGESDADLDDCGDGDDDDDDDDGDGNGDGDDDDGDGYDDDDDDALICNRCLVARSRSSCTHVIGIGASPAIELWLMLMRLAVDV